LTREVRIQRLLDAPPDEVFDVFVDPDAQQELFAGPPDSEAVLLQSSLELRVGGTWTMSFGQSGKEEFRLTYVFERIERPHRIAATFSLDQTGEVEHSLVEVTFEERGGQTLLTLVQKGFESEEQRDSYMSGAPHFLDRLARSVEQRRST
jgi:uncharacterized protein YndB with AHSA1/START domain